jgi:hypothetical protein
VDVDLDLWKVRLLQATKMRHIVIQPAKVIRGHCSIVAAKHLDAV